MSNPKEITNPEDLIGKTITGAVTSSDTFILALGDDFIFVVHAKEYGEQITIGDWEEQPQPPTVPAPILAEGVWTASWFGPGAPPIDQYRTETAGSPFGREFWVFDDLETAKFNANEDETYRVYASYRGWVVAEWTRAGKGVETGPGYVYPQGELRADAPAGA